MRRDILFGAGLIKGVFSSVVDCAEGTVRQFAQQPTKGPHRLRINRVDKIFITHMHADHTMGVITLLRNVLGIAPDPPSAAVPSGSQPPRKPKLKVELFGPAGLRAFVRTILKLTSTRSADRYCVHELLALGEAASTTCDVQEDLHSSEEPGRDIPCGEDGFWRDVVISKMWHGGGKLVVDAVPIVHRDPCVGYIFNEQHKQSISSTMSEKGRELGTEITARPRTVIVLGDTSDPSALIPLILENPQSVVSLLVHEATDAYIPPHIDSHGTTGKNRSHDIVKAKAIAKGHSTPEMAGDFARQIGAERLALNHIGARFPAPHFGAGPSNFRVLCMQEIEDQATRTWKPTNGGRAIAVSDFDRIVIPPSNLQQRLASPSTVPENVQSGSESAVTSSSTSVHVPAVVHTATHYVRGSSSTGRHGRGRGRSSQAHKGSPRYWQGHTSMPTSEEHDGQSGRRREHGERGEREWKPKHESRKFREDSNSSSGPCWDKKPRR